MDKCVIHLMIDIDDSDNNNISNARSSIDPSYYLFNILKLTCLIIISCCNMKIANYH